MPVKEVGGLLTDIGTEELAHMEMICAMVYQLTKDMDVEDAKAAGFDAYYIDHTSGIWPQAAAGIPFTAKEFQSKGDAITDLTENLAAEQKARTVYENLLRMITDPEIREPLKFLRAREIVHFQRFGEALEKTKEILDSKNYYLDVYKRQIQYTVSDFLIYFLESDIEQAKNFRCLILT